MDQKPLLWGQKPLFLGKRPLIPKILYMRNTLNSFYSVYMNIYKIYFVIIELLFLWNNRSNSNYNQIFDYEFGMQGLINILHENFAPIFWSQKLQSERKLRKALLSKKIASKMLMKSTHSLNFYFYPQRQLDINENNIR